MVKRSNRLAQIANVRALAIFLVVLGHSIILYSSGWDLYQTSISVPFLDILKKIIDPIQMPLFFSLSGYLFVFTHQKKRGFIHLLKAKSLRLLVPYISVGLCFMLPIRLAIGYPGYQNIGALNLTLNFLTASDVGHLWFLPALFGIFLLAELILTIVEKIPVIRKFSEFLLCIGAAVLYLEGYRISFGYPPLQSAYGNLIWFSIGYFLCAHRELLGKIYHHPIVKWALTFFSLAMMGCMIFTNLFGVLLSIGTQALLIVTLYGIMPSRTSKISEKVDRNSFGVYLFHSPLIYITFATIPNANPIIVVFLNLVVGGAIAYGLTVLIRKIKLKVLIGE